METKRYQPNLEVRLESLKDQFIAALRATKLVVNHEINGLTLTYEKRRGLENQEGCRVIQTGLMIMLKRDFNGYANIHFEPTDTISRSYRATLEVLAETEQAEQQLAYNALTRISEFINFYNQNHSKRR
jgi:hypothetical protein